MLSGAILANLGRWRPEHFLLVGTLLFGLPLVFATPPFASPDEPSHFFRAWAISEGTLVAEKADGLRGARLPSGLRELEDRAAGLRRPGARSFSLAAVEEALSVPLKSEQRRFQDFRNALQNPVLLYVPQALGCLFVGAVGGPPLIAVYVGRTLNLALATALLFWAVRRLPDPKWWVAAVALTPMALSLRASLSADAMLFALTVAFLAEIAASVEQAADDSPTTLRGSLRLLALAVAVSLTKPVYLPLTFLIFLIPSLRRGSGILRVALPALAISFAVLALHLGTLETVPMRTDPAVDQDAQIATLKAHPIRVAATLVEDLVAHAPRFLGQAFGHKLGWQDVPLALPAEVVVLLAVGLLLLLERPGRVQFRSGGLWLIALVSLAVAILIELALWLQWTPPGQAGVAGVQGRYFLPLALPLAWIVRANVGLRTTPSSRSGLVALTASLIAAVSGVASLVALMRAYSG